jgi:signal transduction histidine kinase
MLDRVSSAFNRHATIVRELAESRERLLSFLHAVGHDIRTPFIGIDTTDTSSNSTSFRSRLPLRSCWATVTPSVSLGSVILY